MISADLCKMGILFKNYTAKAMCDNFNSVGWSSQALKKA